MEGWRVGSIPGDFPTKILVLLNHLREDMRTPEIFLDRIPNHIQPQGSMVNSALF